MYKFIAGSYFQNIKPLTEFTAGAQQLIFDSTKDLRVVIDNHAHLCGLGQNEEFYINNCFHNKNNIVKQIHLKVFENASGITSVSESDDVKNVQYVHRLFALVADINKIIPYKMILLPMDHYYEETGQVNKNKTGFYCSSSSVKNISSNNDKFIPTVSIHPAKPNAIQELEEAHSHGMRIVKWLPNSMNIDCTNSKYEQFYKKVIELNMKILVHIGHEHSVDSGHLNQELGNPLRLRYPLDLGVKIIGAHCATEGESIDLDNLHMKKVDNFVLFSRLMDEPKYFTVLFADISACIGIKRVQYLNKILDNRHWHSRLVYGSDYPVPCIPFVTSTKLLCWHGLIKYKQIKILNEIFYSNPLLYNLIVFRTMRSKSNNKLDDGIFERSIQDI
jgi:hypothetical protein